MEPLVSICIPAYNSERYIKRTIKSALRQTYQNIEVVVVDDCSTDQTVEVVKAINDPRLRLICNEVNLGMTGNWNKCIRSCKGDYIKLVPADDWLAPACIERSMKAFFKHPECALVLVDTYLIDENDKVTGHYAHWPFGGVVKGSRIARMSVLFNNFFGNPVCALFRRSDFEKTGGFDPDIPYILDFDLWLGLAALGDIFMLKEDLSGFRVRSDSNTGVLVGSRGADYTAEHVRLLDKHLAKGNIKLNGLERRFSILWRGARNYLIALYIKIIGSRSKR